MTNGKMSEKENIKEIRKRNLRRAAAFVLIGAFLYRRFLVRRRRKRAAGQTP
ncbi:MAG: hypothetical protein HFH93_02995 [Lachnospiraceae bacterium]|nr:hypothetical protein [Lachnospiraceae bacterium]